MKYRGADTQVYNVGERFILVSKKGIIRKERTIIVVLDLWPAYGDANEWNDEVQALSQNWTTEDEQSSIASGGVGLAGGRQDVDQEAPKG